LIFPRSLLTVWKKWVTFSAFSLVSGINATIIRGLCKVIGTTLTKYKDPASQNLVKELLVALIKQHHDLTYEHFNNVLKALATKELASAPPLKGSQAAVLALGWSNLIAEHGKRDNDVGKKEFPKLLESQAALYQISLTSGIKKVSEKAFSFLKDLWAKKDEFERVYFEKLLAMEPSNSVIVFIAAVLRYCEEELDDQSLLEGNKQKILDHFVKGVITVKVKPNANDVPNCRIILKSMTKEEFKVYVA
jgi:hypothetical protein